MNTRAISSKRINVAIRKIITNRWLLLLLLPGLAYYIIIKYIPMYGLIIAFKDYNLKKGIVGSEWIGFKNFISFFSYPYFFRLLKNTFLLNFYGLIIGFPLPIIFALILNEVRILPLKKAVQTISYMPHFISIVAVVGMLTLILSPRDGIVNKIITDLGGEPIYFMAETEWFRTLYISSDIWQGLGWSAILYIAAITSINPDLYEAAYMDGASRIKQMIHITLPGILPTITILLLLRIGTLLSSSTQKVLLMQAPITYEVSDIIGTYVYRRGLIKADFSFGTAVDLFNSLINIILIVSANLFIKRLGSDGIW